MLPSTTQRSPLSDDAIPRDAKHAIETTMLMHATTRKT
jgi:hypothetical protein